MTHQDQRSAPESAERAQAGQPLAPISVVMLGLRGCPDVQGGVERHVEELAPRLAALGCQVEVLARRPYLAPNAPSRWRGVAVTPLASPRQRSLEALLHTGLGVIYAARKRPDLLHIHAIGPALMAPLARLLGLRVAVTHHGHDYHRAKWGFAARMVLRAGEWAGMRFANLRIAVSEPIAAAMRRSYGIEVASVPNGVSRETAPTSTGTLDEFGLRPRRYVLLVARLVPEKRHLDLIEAFARAAPTGWKLVLVGGADHPNRYSDRVIEAAKADSCIVATGFQVGLPLRELVAHAGLFVLPSSHEGLPIALLEALSFGVPVLASDIPANRQVGLDADCLFPVGDVERLAQLIAHACSRTMSQAERDAARERVLAAYDWDLIASRTLELYRQALAGPHALAVPSPPRSHPRSERAFPGRPSRRDQPTG